MKVLFINGSPHEKGCTYTALKEVADTLEKSGVATVFHWIGIKPVAGCTACGICGRAGVCVFDDGVNEILECLDEYDGIVVGSPVYYGGPSGQLCCLLDRLFFASRGRMNGKLGAAVVSCRRGGATTAFSRLNMYFAMNNMPIVPSQYWNMVHGMDPREVRKDEEGMQTMRTLGRNMARLLTCLDKADPVSDVEPPKYTNFIR